MKNFIKRFILIPMALGVWLNVNAQDWADLNHFRADNNLLEKPHPEEKRVVFMGNSITIGWSKQIPEFFSQNPYVNRGISGQTTPQMLLRFRQDVINLNPAAVVILAGTNDIAGNTGPSSLEMILDNIISMAELAKANDISVILCSVLPAYDYPWRKGLQPNTKIPKLNKMIKDYCENNGALYLDYFSAMTDGKNGMRPELATDGVHPNRKGYELMAPMVQDAIKKVIK
ncbi:SGNH/GDSL hydrolase family protein [Eudoraea chungangensis]|uniref:SGNH/GDSL hydrolase family protein n=1 Tax=Eudoraea chungangensis TaxID=1481905 RepID=UPI0023EDEC09|nr:SGNH/GDSL hydrolase family protein [Eudoraea chungangensis]